MVLEQYHYCGSKWLFFNILRYMLSSLLEASQKGLQKSGIVDTNHMLWYAGRSIRVYCVLPGILAIPNGMFASP